MAKYEIKDQKELIKELEKLTTEKPGHADVFNALFEPLLNNDNYLEKKLNEIADDLAGSTTALINVSTSEAEFIGQEVVCKGAGTETAVFSDDGTCAFKARYLGTYTIQCMDDSTTVEVTTLGIIYNAVINKAPRATINVTTPNSDMYGQEIICSDGSETLTGTFSESGECSFRVQNLEKYTLTCVEWSTSLYIEDLTATYDAVIQHSQTLDELLETATSFTFVDQNTKYYDEPIIWRFIEHNHSGDPANSITISANNILTFKVFDAMEADSSVTARQTNGHERWVYSNMYQWLNSAAPAGEWYTAQHSVDAPPTSANVYGGMGAYDYEAGFLNDFSKSFKEALLDVTKTCAYYPTDGNTTTISYETVTQKVFIPAQCELGISDDGSNSAITGSKEGNVYATSTISALPTTQAIAKSGVSVDNNQNCVMLRTLGSQGEGMYVAVFTTHPYNSGYAYLQHQNKDSDANNQQYAFGVVPYCCIPDTVKFSVEPNEDGHYEIIW